MEGLGSFVVLAHAHLAGLPDHEDLMFLFPLLLPLMILMLRNLKRREY